MTWTLLFSLLVKSSIVAGGGLAGARFLTRRPVERVDILRAAVCLLLALPAIMNMLPPLELALLPPLPAEPAVAPLAGGLPAPTETPLWWTTPGAMMGGAWLLGAALIGGRLALGLRTLERWTRKGQPVTDAAWLAPIKTLPPIDRPGVVASDRVAGPLSWGVAPGTILLDPATLAEPRAAPAIMAHELAHLRRHDWIFLILSRLTLAIFWFNPLVWRLHATLAERAEEAADAAALTHVDRALYARTLVRLAATPAPLGAPREALAMAADAKTLKTRIACIMTDTPERRRPLTVGLTVAALAIVATPLAAFGLSRQIAPPAPPAPPVAVTSAPMPPAPPAEAAPPAPPAPPARHARTESDAYDTVQARAQAEWDRNQAHAQAEWARAQAEAARVNAEEIRRQVEAHRDEIEAAARLAAQQARLSGEEARRIGEQARLAGEEARRAGEQARRDGERIRVQAMRQARVDMAKGAVQMRDGARQMRDEAARLRDPAYRAKQIQDNRARGHDVTDAELQDLSRRLPGQADDLERQADRLAEQVKDMT
ncbi:M56 family metallopeptidase [Caulobacter segnis]|uniref:M56 family metallopeptidase n=1 Tax=Caulobacter segnis TaxID=88688 RepID=UPI001CBEBDF0|nr:M56 family metallopeptidase [Caulobacter segnis]UAL09808.1 peptidase M56 [Caulobacter segnis]